MYIFELANKLIKACKKRQAENMDIEYSEETEIPKCEHIFLPIDSTGETLACSKCGLLIKKNDKLNSWKIK